MSETLIQVHDTAGLADAIAARLLTRLAEAQQGGGAASIVLTGGRVAAAVFGAVAASPDRDTVNWSQVDVWWGDERFLPTGHPDRNETQARAALLDALPLDPARVHPMPASDGPDGDDPDAAAARYAHALAASGSALPRLDVLLLGVGEDGHVASVFPGHPVSDQSVDSQWRLVVAVRDSPKPPPVRITLTLPAINTAREVWLFAAGADKAHAVGLALGGTVPLPAGAVHGVERTLWLIDQAAAAEIPPSGH